MNVILNLIKVQSLVSKKFDSLSLHGLGLTDFMILHILYHAPSKRLKRIELAEKTGLTASGITRLLLPLEKTGLVSKDINQRDARISYVQLTETGGKIFEEASVTAERIASQLSGNMPDRSLEKFNSQLLALGADLPL